MLFTVYRVMILGPTWDLKKDRIMNEQTQHTDVSEPAQPEVHTDTPESQPEVAATAPVDAEPAQEPVGETPAE